jgi:hypothetical protein
VRRFPPRRAAVVQSLTHKFESDREGADYSGAEPWEVSSATSTSGSPTASSLRGRRRTSAPPPPAESWSRYLRAWEFNAEVVDAYPIMFRFGSAVVREPSSAGHQTVNEQPGERAASEKASASGTLGLDVVAPSTGVLNELPDPDPPSCGSPPQEARMGVGETSSAEPKSLLRPTACDGPRRRQGRSSGGALHFDPVCGPSPPAAKGRRWESRF